MALIHQQIGVIVALILLVVAIFLFGVPLVACLRKILWWKRHDSDSSPRTVVSSHHAPFQRGPRMSPRRQDSQETLLDELVNIGDDKLDGTLSPLFILRPPAMAYSLVRITTVIDQQPFHLIPSSLCRPR